MRNLTIIFVFLVSSTFILANNIYWTGNAKDNDFFNEANWKIEGSESIPLMNSINPNQSIDADLIINNIATIIEAKGIVNLGSGSLNLTGCNIIAEAIAGGSLIMNSDAYLDLVSKTPLSNAVKINFKSGLAWVRTLNLKGVDIESKHLNQIQVEGQASIYTANLRLDNYYLDGTVIRSNGSTVDPLTMYSNKNLQGSNAKISVDRVYTGAGIPNNMNKEAESFLLKKGFMVTFAANSDGTGKSKNYIASEKDLIIEELPSYLVNEISFVRVVPWNWVTKKGVSSATIELNSTWKYLWNNTGASTINREFAPMSWGAGGANSDAVIELYKTKYKSTHVMGFNESDNCNDQSGRFNNLCQPAVAVGFYKNLMKTGLRLVSPNCREEAPFGWLKQFHDIASAQDVRIDVIGVHWYDWGSNPVNSPNADPVMVFNRFKSYLDRVYALYKLPIWISEFNANPNRSSATNLEFMKLALPYLESLDYVERYCWYQPNSGVANYYQSDGTSLTAVGLFYRDQISTPSITKAIVDAPSSLDLYYNILSPVIDDKLDLEVSIYPNPTENYFTVQSSVVIDAYDIFDNLGKLVKTANNLNASNFNVEIQSLKSGIHFLILKDVNGVKINQKIVLKGY